MVTVVTQQQRETAQKGQEQVQRQLSEVQRARQQWTSQQALRRMRGRAGFLKRKEALGKLSQAESQLRERKKLYEQVAKYPTREEYVGRIHEQQRQAREQYWQQKVRVRFGRGSGQTMEITLAQKREAIELAQAQIAKGGRGPAFYGRSEAVKAYGRHLVSEALRRPLAKLALEPGVRIGEAELKYIVPPPELRRQWERRLRIAGYGIPKTPEIFKPPLTLSPKNTSSNKKINWLK